VLIASAGTSDLGEKSRFNARYSQRIEVLLIGQTRLLIRLRQMKTKTYKTAD
jgi:hypothetical protein